MYAILNNKISMIITVAAQALIFSASANDIVSGSVSPAMTINARTPAPVSKKVIMNFVADDRRMTALIFLKVLFIISIFISCSLWPGEESNPLYVFGTPKKRLPLSTPGRHRLPRPWWGGRLRPYAEQLTAPPGLSLERSICLGDPSGPPGTQNGVEMNLSYMLHLLSCL